VSIPDDDIVDLNNTAFGPNIQQGMREILGLRADRARRVRAREGSGARAVGRERARSERPADLAASPELAAGVAGPGAQVQRLPHDAGYSAAAHSLARPQRLVQAAWAGASGTGGRSRHARHVLARRGRDDGRGSHAHRVFAGGCRSRVPQRAIDPSVDLLYCDAWTNPMVRTPDASFSYEYAKLTTDAPVTDTNCLAPGRRFAGSSSTTRSTSIRSGRRRAWRMPLT